METVKSKFEINKTVYHNGFSMTFENGYTISIQFSEKNYSDGKTTAEVAAWSEDGTWFKLGSNDDVVGWRTTDEVADLIQLVKNL